MAVGFAAVYKDVYAGCGWIRMGPDQVAWACYAVFCSQMAYHLWFTMKDMKGLKG